MVLLVAGQTARSERSGFRAKAFCLTAAADEFRRRLAGPKENGTAKHAEHANAAVELPARTAPELAFRKQIMLY